MPYWRNNMDHTNGFQSGQASLNNVVAQCIHLISPLNAGKGIGSKVHEGVLGKEVVSPQ